MAALFDKYKKWVVRLSILLSFLIVSYVITFLFMAGFFISNMTRFVPTDRVPPVGDYMPCLYFGSHSKKITIIPFMLYYSRSIPDYSVTISFHDHSRLVGDMNMVYIHIDSLIFRYSEADELVVIPGSADVRYNIDREKERIDIDPTGETITRISIYAGKAKTRSLIGPIQLRYLNSFTVNISGTYALTSGEETEFTWANDYVLKKSKFTRTGWDLMGSA